MLKLEKIKRLLPCVHETAICAVSGGPDSMCLLYILNIWREKCEFDLIAAHFNHELRENAARDEKFVRDWCAEKNIKFIAGRENIKAFAAREKLSIEEAARIARYRFLKNLAREYRADWIYTAHHADDNAETVLLNLIRGTGIAGLTGMKFEDNGIRRPFLDIARDDLQAYAELNNIKYIHDESNFDPDAAARNFLRLKIMPLLKEINSKATEHIGAAARRLERIDDALDADAKERVLKNPEKTRDGRVILPVKILREANDAVRPKMILYALDELGIGRKDIGAAHLDAIEKLYINNIGGREKRLNLPYNIIVYHDQDRIIFERRPRKLTEIELTPGIELNWGDYKLLLYEDYNNININNIKNGLIFNRSKRDERGELIERDLITVKSCALGERLFLPGANGSRSVKRLCLDKKINLSERDGLPAIYINGILAGVWRLGVDAAFTPEDRLCRFVKIEKINEI